MKIAFISCWCNLRVYAIQAVHLKEHIEKYLNRKIYTVTSNCGCFYSDLTTALSSLFKHDHLLIDRCDTFISLPHFRYHNDAKYLSKGARTIYRLISEPLRGYLYSQSLKDSEIVHFHQSADAFGYAALKWFLSFNTKSKKIVSIHLLSEIQKRETELNTIYNKADAIITSTHYMKQFLVKCGVKENIIFVIPYGSTINALKEGTREGLIMFAGSPLINTKGFEYLAPALKILKNEGLSIPLKLHGYHMQGHKEWADKIAQKEGIDDLVTWLNINSEDDLIDHYQSSLCCVIPYTDYPGCFPATMAMAAATPIISSDAWGLPEYVDGNGLVVKAKSTIELADSIRLLLNDKESLLKLGHAGRAKAEREYSWGTLADKTLKIYNKFM